jgi:hypothetical protein
VAVNPGGITISMVLHRRVDVVRLQIDPNIEHAIWQMG